MSLTAVYEAKIILFSCIPYLGVIILYGDLADQYHSDPLPIEGQMTCSHFLTFVTACMVKEASQNMLRKKD